MRAPKFLSALSASVLCFSSSSLFSSAAFGYGHGSTPDVESFVRQQERVFLSAVPQSLAPERAFSRASAKNGATVVVTRTRPARPLASVAFTRTPGSVLAFYEGSPGETLEATIARVKAAGGMVAFSHEGVSLVSISMEGFLALAKDARIFLDAVSTKETSVRARNIPLKSGASANTVQAAMPVFEPDSERLMATLKELSGETSVDVGGQQGTITERGGNAERSRKNT